MSLILKLAIWQVWIFRLLISNQLNASQLVSDMVFKLLVTGSKPQSQEIHLSSFLSVHWRQINCLNKQGWCWNTSTCSRFRSARRASYYVVTVIRKFYNIRVNIPTEACNCSWHLLMNWCQLINTVCIYQNWVTKIISWENYYFVFVFNLLHTLYLKVVLNNWKSFPHSLKKKCTEHLSFCDRQWSKSW